jgi:IS5 family transposase
VTTFRQGWIVGIDAVHGNPYDGAMLKPALAQVKKLASAYPHEAFVDKGFRDARYHPKAVQAYVSGRRTLCAPLGKLLKRRTAIELVIGPAKHDHGMERNHFLRTLGDRINALLSGRAWNLRKR